MKKILFLFLVCLMSNTLSAQTKTFSGAWFDIKYPAKFKAKASMKSASSSTGCESATFTSPDNSVQFYVFSPQWNGDATDIALKKNEKIISSQIDTTGERREQTIKIWTIAANDSSYSRSYQEKENLELNVKYVVGIKYKDKASYEKYKKQYLAFKGSLIQYGD
jgi:hypothetical protein